MTYSFFGTCFNDHNHLFACLETILNQTILPQEIILVNSGDENIEKRIINMINEERIKFIYIHSNLSRAEALNVALNKSTSVYSFRF